MVIFPRALEKLQNGANFSIFSHLKLFSVCIINGSNIKSCEVGHTG